MPVIVRWTVFFSLILSGVYASAVDSRYLDLGIGSDLESFQYAEELSPPGKSTEAANLALLEAEAKYYPMGGLSFFDLKFQTANNVSSKYVGSDLNTGAPMTSTDQLAFTNFESDLNFAVFDFFSVYAGYGWRQWNRFLAGNPGYREIYSWSYNPIGTQFWYRGDSFDFGLDVSERPSFNGSIKVITSQTYAGGADSEMTLGNRIGYRIALPVVWREDFVSISVTPWFEHSAIGESNEVTNTTLAPHPGEVIYEPNSHTNQYGLDLLLSFTVL